jgi:hypothetical protein
MMGADALGGLRGCRVLSALLTGLTALLAYGIAREITRDDPVGGRLVWLAPALVWLQPLVLTLAQTTLTETPAALYVALAVWLALRRRTVAAAAVVSLLFVTRIETVVFAPLLALGLLRTPSPIRGWIALAWAPTAWILAVILLRVSPEASPFVLLERSYVDAYGTGPWHHFAVRWLIAAGVGVLALAAAGTVHAGKRAWLPAGAALAYFLLHTVLFRFGLFASGGYERFLVPVAGLLGALGAVGAGALFFGRGRGAPVAALVVLAAAPLALLEHDVPPVVRGVAVVLAAFGALGAVGLLLARGRFRRAAVVVGTMTLVLTVAEAVLLVRPLRVAGAPPAAARIPLDEAASTAKWRFDAAVLARPLAPRTLVEDALLWRVLIEAEEAHPQAPLYTSRAFIRAHRLGALRVEDAAAAREAWAAAPPGSLFVWGGAEEEEGAWAPFSPEDAGLDGHGHVVARSRAGIFEARAYLK